MYDVIVIGAGPAGNCVASGLAQKGYRVLVLERRKQPGDKLCAGLISGECIRHFAISESSVLRWVNGARLFSPSGDMIELRRDKPPAAIIDRPAFDRTMAQRAQSQGAEYLFESLAVDLSCLDDCISVTVDRQNGRVELKAKAAVIASGFPSNLYGATPKISDFVLGAQVEVRNNGIDEIEAHFGQEKAPGFFAWLMPLPSGVVRVGLLTRHDPRFYLGKFLLSLQAAGRIVLTGAEAGFAMVPLKPINRTYGERFIIVGDAAGQVKPTTCGGIYYSLLCAEMAVDTLQQALVENDFSARSLSSYERKWHKKLKRELEIDYYARKFFERLSDHRIDRLFEVIRTNKIDEALVKADDVSFDWHSSAILKLMEHRAMTKALDVLKAPFLLNDKDKERS